MSETKKRTKKTTSDKYIETKRVGAIGANIFRRTAQGGFEYYDFNLSRAWKSSSEKEGYSQSFFAKNRDALCQAIHKACDRIEELENAAGEPASAPVEAEGEQPVNGVQSTAA